MQSTITKLIVAFLSVSLLAATPSALRAKRVHAVQAAQTDSASAALREGRRLLKRGKADQALVQLNTALRLYSAAKNGSRIAAVENELGDLYMRQGQYTVALEHYKKALDGFMGESKKQDSTTAAAGVADSRLATASSAVASIADDKFNANLMLAKIGMVNFRLGRMSEASAAFAQMQVKKPEGAATKISRRFGGLGGIMGGLSSGDVAVQVPTSLAVGAWEFKKEFDEYRNGIVYSNYELGTGRIAYFNNDLESAKKHFQNALDGTNAGLASLGKIGQTRRVRAAARTSLGDVALRQGKLKDANKFYADAVKGATEDKRLDLIWPAQRGLGQSLWLQGAQEKDPKKGNSLREQALGNYREALKTIETLRAGSLRADESRTTFLSTFKDVFDEAGNAFAEMAMLTGPGDPAAGLSGKALDYAAEAFRVSEQSRARSLLDLLSETNAAVTEGVPTDLLKRKQENLDRQQELAEQLSGLSSSDEPKKKPADLDSELDKLQVEYDEVENQIRTASPRYAALTAGQPLTLAEVQQKVLDDQTVLLEYGLGANASYLWAVSSKEVRLYKLPGRSALDKLATDLRAQLIPSKLQRRIVGIDVAADATRGLGVASAAEDAAPFIAAANAVYKAAVEPAAAVIGQKRLLIVADGALNYIPFESLLTSASPGDYASLPYLLKTNEIVYAPSASVIGAIRQHGNKATGRAMLLIADPVFNSNDVRSRGAVSSAESAETRGLGIESALNDVAGQGAAAAAESGKMQGLPLARLTGTRTEAEQIATLARASGGSADSWLDLKASEETLQATDVSKYRVVHVATHGLLNAERPQFTGLVLSLVGNKSEDGFLRTDEVFNLKLGAPFVMLSACETGLGKEKRGEGVMGLTRAFMYAGAPTVGVSLWSVADKSTAELMTDFYRRWLGTGPAPAAGSPSVSPAAAMRDAQLAMITGKKYSAPFYWAPFVLVGDWR